MANKYKVGDTAFFVESNRIIREVKIVGVGGGFYTIRFLDGNGGIKVKGHRLFDTKKEAEASLPKKKTSRFDWL